MGDITEMILDGVLCKDCGGFVGVELIIANGGEVDKNGAITAAPGFPISCCKE